MAKRAACLERYLSTEWHVELSTAFTRGISDTDCRDEIAHDTIRSCLYIHAEVSEYFEGEREREKEGGRARARKDEFGRDP